MLRLSLIFAAVAALCWTSVATAQPKLTRDQQVRKDKQDFAENDAWFYDDLDAAIEEAEKTKRPLIVVFR